MNKMRKIHFTATITAVVTMGIASGSVLAEKLEVPLPGPGDFTAPFGPIDNQYWPLRVGTTLAYMAETEDGCEYNKLAVTSDTEEISIDGMIYTTLIVRDQEWESEECDPWSATLAEDTHDFYAMDSDNNVWYFGEDTWSIDEESEFCTEDGAWLAGEDEAEAGIVMLGSPRSGDRYRQEYWEDEAEDWGAVLRLNAKVSIDYLDSEFEDCLMTREWTPLEPGEIEHKFYCPQDGNLGPGLMFIAELKGKTVYVEYVGADFGFDLPGDAADGFEFPALEAVDSCTMPEED
jgi:hypothetical protein